MIQFVSKIRNEYSPPILMKEFVLNDSVEMSATIDISNSEELSEVPSNILEEHKENIITYIKNISGKISLPDPEVRVDTLYPLKHWDEITHVVNQLCDIWYWQNIQISLDILQQNAKET